jgi:hypothetical protein
MATTGQEKRDRTRVFLQTLEGYSVPEGAAAWRDMCRAGKLLNANETMLATLREIAQCVPSKDCTARPAEFYRMAFDKFIAMASEAIEGA